MILIPRSAWKWTRKDGEHVVKVRCPRCRLWILLDSYSIDEDGIIHPSLICSADPRCQFRDYVELQGYSAREDDDGAV